QQYVGWQARATVQYRMRRAKIDVGAMRAVTNGAGVLNGAVTNSGQGSVNFILAREWSMSLNGGLSSNQELGTQVRYDSQYAGLTVNRLMGRYLNIFVSYD